MKWKNCDKAPPKHNGYYAVKHDLTKHGWYVSYYLQREAEWLFITYEREWRYYDKPWMWAKLPEVEDNLI